MRTARAHCETCGDVSLDVTDITVRLCVDTGTGTYVFRCPSCEKPVVHQIHPSLKALLLTSGANLVPWFLPEELFEEKSGPPLTSDDLLDFHEALNR